MIYDNGDVTYQNKMQQMTWAPVTDTTTAQKIINEILATIGTLGVDDSVGKLILTRIGQVVVDGRGTIILRKTSTT